MLETVSKYNLFIFDLDDTLIKSEVYHYEAWIETIKNRKDKNFMMSYDFYISIFHSENPDSIKNYIINNLEFDKLEFDNIIKEKFKNYLNILKRESKNIKMIDGAEKLLKLILENNKKFVIVSNSFKNNIDFFCDLFPILKNSSKNYYREILKNKKPNPECYLKVVEDFPDEKYKIGFEDSITGIKALSQVKDIEPFFINNKNYYYYNYIINNYDIKHIENYNYIK
jgi:beta-phosphoglucomutase-like phosphatase (HAD superfamily)